MRLLSGIRSQQIRFLFWVLPALLASQARGQILPRRLVVEARAVRCQEVPLAVAVDSKWAENDYVLERERDGGRFLGWIGSLPGEQGKRFYTVLDELPQATDESFRVTVRDDSAAVQRPIATIQRNLEAEHTPLRFLLDGERVTEVRTDQGYKPIFWPLIGPTGVPYTRAYPMERVEGEDQDHPHQRSLWFTHGAVNGVDFWAEGPGKGRIVLRESGAWSGGGCAAVGRLVNEWVGPDARPICRERTTVTMYGTRGLRVLDFDIALAPAGEQAVVLGDTKEGSFGVRMASTMDVKRKQGGQILNAENLRDGDAWGKRSAWVDYSGPVGEGVGGIAILNHPSSFRYPTPWHVRDYGLFAANPFGNHDFGIAGPGEHRLEPGESLTLRYRLILHRGRAGDAGIAAHHEVYANPPRIRLEP